MPLRKRIHTTVSDRFPASTSEKPARPAGLLPRKRRASWPPSHYSTTGCQAESGGTTGIDLRTTMPSNAEVESALRAYQEFYGGQQHIHHLQKMRKIALNVMRSLESFHPRLVGPVLEGTADEHARVSLHVFNDPPDAIAIHLLDKGWFSQ